MLSSPFSRLHVWQSRVAMAKALLNEDADLAGQDGVFGLATP